MQIDNIKFIPKNQRHPRVKLIKHISLFIEQISINSNKLLLIFIPILIQISLFAESHQLPNKFIHIIFQYERSQLISNLRFDAVFITQAKDLF